MRFPPFHLHCIMSISCCQYRKILSTLQNIDNVSPSQYNGCVEVLSMYGQRIRETREHFGITQQELADRIRMAQSAVSAWEQNRKTPSGRAVAKVANALGVTTDYLLCSGRRMIPFQQRRRTRPVCTYRRSKKSFLSRTEGCPLRGKRWCALRWGSCTPP